MLPILAFNLGGSEILLVVFLALLLFGSARLPKLFRTYVRHGARVCSPPALDRQFKTIDFLVLFEIGRMDRTSVRLFFS